MFWPFLVLCAGAGGGRHGSLVPKNPSPIKMGTSAGSDASTGDSSEGESVGDVPSSSTSVSVRKDSLGATSDPGSAVHHPRSPLSAPIDGSGSAAASSAPDAVPSHGGGNGGGGVADDGGDMVRPTAVYGLSHIAPPTLPGRPAGIRPDNAVFSAMEVRASPPLHPSSRAGAKRGGQQDMEEVR